MKKARMIGFSALIAIWALLTLGAWFSQPKDISDSERRKLAQFPDLTVQSLLDGRFMSGFESYTLDQFPLRDSFRQIKAMFHYNVLQQGDNNDIYLEQGYAAQLEYPLNEASVSHATGLFNRIYENHLKDKGGKILLSIVPDKGYYLAEEGGYPAMNYDALFQQVQTQMPWAEYVDITGDLAISDYYRTDTHWRQERIGKAADRLCEALGTTAFSEEELVQTQVDRPFYGVYHGQAALPLQPETMFTMGGEILDGCTVYNHETGKTTAIYDPEKLQSRDLYDIYLSGAAALLTIDNPVAQTDRELIVFRDSFGSSMVPLLVKDYKKVTVVDIRYIATDYLDAYVTFSGQDVLFLYSTLILNNSGSLK